MKELMEAIDMADGVKTITYDRNKGKWLITYQYDALHDWVDSDVLIDFLNNA